jgi:hypothetical protein
MQAIFPNFREIFLATNPSYCLRTVCLSRTCHIFVNDGYSSMGFDLVTYQSVESRRPQDRLWYIESTLPESLRHGLIRSRQLAQTRRRLIGVGALNSAPRRFDSTRAKQSVLRSQSAALYPGSSPFPEYTLFFESFLDRRDKAPLRFLVICGQSTSHKSARFA